MILAIKDLLGKTYDTMYNTEPYLALCNPALDVICPLGAYTDLTLDAKINEISELNLCVHKYTETGELNPCYGYVEKRKYIFVKGVGYFRISDCSEQNTGDDDIKKVITAESKEAEIANINVPDLGEDLIKTYVDARGETQRYRVTSYTLKLYDEDEHGAMSRCVISVIASVLKNWTFNLSRLVTTRAMASSAYTFGTSDGGQDSVGDNVYNFLTGEVADAFDVLFLFDTLNSQIYPVYREDYYDKTSLFFDRANIVESLTKNEKQDTFCTCLELSITDELRPYLMAANPTGMYLYDFSYFTDNNDDMKWMNNTLKARIEEWEAAVEEASSGIDAQTLRCLEAWNAELNMREVATRNETLYDKQCEALKSSLNGLSTNAQIATLETYYTNSAVQGSVLSQIGAAEITAAQTTYKNVTIGECERRLQMLRSLTHAMYYPETVTGVGEFDIGTYVNSTFNIESVANGTTEGGYHVWTPKFRVFQNTAHYTPAGNFPWAAGTNELAAGVAASFAYTKSGTTEGGSTYIISLDTTQRTYTYTPFPDDSDGKDPAPTSETTINVTGATMRLHFYHYDETHNTFFKLHIGSISGDLYADYAPTISQSHDITDTADITLTDAVPKKGYYYLGTTDPTTGNTTYEVKEAEVNYMRMELFINDPYLVTAFTVTDARLWYYVLINHLLDFNRDQYLPENYFTADEYAQVSRYIETLSYSNDNIVVTEYDDMAAREQLALDFLEAAKKQLSNTVVPVMECSVNSGSAIFSDDYDGIRNELTLGSFARVEFDENQYAELPLEEVNINWQECSFGMTFGTFRKKGSRWSDLLSQTLSTQRQVDIKATEAYSFVKDNTLGSVKEALISGLNTNKMRLYSSETDYQIDQYGATWTSVDKDDNKYQIVIADGTVACVVTDKNGLSEVKTALGKYIYVPPGSNTGVIRYGVYGGSIIAESITADAIAAGAIKARQIDSGAVTSDKIFAGAVTIGKIGSGAVQNGNLAENAVGTTNIQNNAINSNKISESGGWTITTSHMLHQGSGGGTDGLIAPAGETVTDVKAGVNSAGTIRWEMLLGTSQNFGVDTTGKLYARYADIGEGSEIGGWIIDGASIRNTGSNVLLISNGIIPQLGQSDLTNRTLIGNFASSAQVTGFDLPNYLDTDVDTHTWQILTGVRNTFKFGVTSTGEIYTRDVKSGGMIRNQTGLNSSDQQRNIEHIDESDWILRTLIGNFPQTTSDYRVQFPNLKMGAASDTPNWQVLVGFDDFMRFGLDWKGTPYLPYDTILSYGTNEGEQLNLVDWINRKQNALTAGSNIQINGTTISVTPISTTFEHAGSAGFDQVTSAYATKVGNICLVRVNIQRTGGDDNIAQGQFYRFLGGSGDKAIPSAYRTSSEQLFTVVSKEGHIFQIKVPANSTEIQIARMDGRPGQDMPHTITCNIPYFIT